MTGTLTLWPDADPDYLLKFKASLFCSNLSNLWLFLKQTTNRRLHHRRGLVDEALVKVPESGFTVVKVRKRNKKAA